MIAGVLTSVLLGWAMYRAVAKVNLGRLFTWTAALLILVAAGIAEYAVHGFQVAGALLRATINLTAKGHDLAPLCRVVLLVFFLPSRRLVAA